MGTGPSDRLRVVVTVPLSESLCRLVEKLEPRVSMVRRDDLLKPMRGPADWSGDPAWVRDAARQEQFEALVDSADALFGIPDVDPVALARTVAANPTLRWVMTTAAGGGSQIKQAGLPQADLQRIAFTTSAGAHGEPLAEFALFGVLAGAKCLPRMLADQATKSWPQRWEMRQLDEMTVLVVGLGHVGAACARLLNASGATVWGTTRTGAAVPGVRRLVPIGSLVKAVAGVNAIVLALPGTAATRHLISTHVLSAVKRGAIIVNVGRGTVIDEPALLDALDDERVSFAALDVFESEPLPTASPLWEHPRVLVSPHTAGLSVKEEERIARMFAANATRLLDGEPLHSTVNMTEFY